MQAASEPVEEVYISFILQSVQTHDKQTTKKDFVKMLSAGFTG